LLAKRYEKLVEAKGIHKMPSQFHVGQHCRNRDGEYEVISVEGTAMKVRYLDGHIGDHDIASQARIWERIQEEESFGAEDYEVDFSDAKNRPASRNTGGIAIFVDEVLRTVPQPWQADITDQVFLAIERNRRWLATYEKLVVEFDKQTVNSEIGRYTLELTRMDSSGQTKAAKSTLIKSYTRFVVKR